MVYPSAAVICVYMGSFTPLAENRSLLVPQVAVFFTPGVALKL